MPASTRSTRSGSSGQPSTGHLPTGPGPPRALHQPPRPWRSDPANAGLAGADTGGAAARVGRSRPRRDQAHPERTGQAGQSGRRRRHTVAPSSMSAWFQAQDLAGRHQDGRQPAPRAGEGPALPAGQHPADVGVDHPDLLLEGKGQDRRRCRARCQQRPQGGEVGRQAAAVVGHDRPGAAVQVDGPPVVAQSLPGADDVGHGRLGAGRRGGEPARNSAVAATRPTPVCWAITSDTSTAHGSRVSRHGSGEMPRTPGGQRLVVRHTRVT